MKIYLQARGSLDRGTIAVWSNDDRTVEVHISMVAKRPQSDEDIFVDGSVIPQEIEVDIDV